VKQRAAVFLDRDGVLNGDVGYPHRLEDAILFDDVVPALRRIQNAGYVLLVVSNQSGVARGLFTLNQVSRFNRAIAEQLHKANIRITGKNFYVCPHGPRDECSCRKPKPGLLLKAARQHKIDLERSFTIGDEETDIEAGRRAGTQTVLLDRAGKNRKTKADLVASSLSEAADLVQSRRGTLAGSFS